MLYLFTATNQEARALIDFYRLSRHEGQTRLPFPVFSNEEAGIRLTVTGRGTIAAAAAVGSVCTRYEIEATDFLLNIGLCAGRMERGGLFLCNQIIEQSTGKAFYPDMLYRHPFMEARVVTTEKPPEKTTQILQGNSLYDGEAASVCQSGSYFFAPHRMGFLKIVSDYGDTWASVPKQAGRLIGDGLAQIEAYRSSLAAVGKMECGENAFQQDVAEDFVAKVCGDMRCSYVMASSLRQYIHYCALAGIDAKAVFRGFYREGKLPCKNKREGKLCFEEFKRRLL